MAAMDVDGDKGDNVRSVEGKNGVIFDDVENDPIMEETVARVREKFLEEFEANAELYIESDIAMITSCDYFIRRFLYPNDMNVELAFEQFREWMAWRKTIGFETASDSRFPSEFYQIGALFPYREDKDGTLILYMRFKVYKKLDILVDPIKKFIVYNINKLDNRSRKERSWAVVFDTRGAGLSQVDFDMLIFLVKTVKQYYPWGLKYVAIYELPWLLQGAWRIAQTLLPQEATKLFKFCDRNSIKELISGDNLPDFMDGSCQDDYRKPPEGCRPAEEVAGDELGLGPQEVKVVIKHFEKHLQDYNKNKNKVTLT
ncbi:Motile sperm domain-containing protein 2 [Halotydeus destructor]|nr:Motile sperm domain-containing protein 2 [Halotydeus destructor]